MKFGSGAIYNGQWVNGCQSGNGEERYDDGAVYLGEFVNGKRQGWGTLTHANGVC